MWKDEKERFTRGLPRQDQRRRMEILRGGSAVAFIRVSRCKKKMGRGKVRKEADRGGEMLE